MRDGDFLAVDPQRGLRALLLDPHFNRVLAIRLEGNRLARGFGAMQEELRIAAFVTEVKGIEANAGIGLAMHLKLASQR